jgi:hypothetical protein
VLLLLAASACGNDQAPDPAAASGTVRSTGTVTVLDDGGGPQLCVGVIKESMPPQCEGLEVTGWDWADHPEHEKVGETRWGDFQVTGTLDDTTFAVTDALPADDASVPPVEDVDFSSPCPEPEGGWKVIDPERTTFETQDATVSAAHRLPGYSDLWLDQTRVARPMNDPRKIILNVRVTGDPAAAEKELRKTWGGMLCVSRATLSQEELGDIQDELADQPDHVSSGLSRGVIRLRVLLDDGSLQQRLDETYGKGTVILESAVFEPVG